VTVGVLVGLWLGSGQKNTRVLVFLEGIEASLLVLACGWASGLGRQREASLLVQKALEDLHFSTSE
jgi:hypothetical protein